MSCVKCLVSCDMCHLSHITCHISHVTCHMSHVMCHMSIPATAIATDSPSANSPTMHNRLFCKDQKLNQLVLICLHNYHLVTSNNTRQFSLFIFNTPLSWVRAAVMKASNIVWLKNGHHPSEHRRKTFIINIWLGHLPKILHQDGFLQKMWKRI